MLVVGAYMKDVAVVIHTFDKYDFLWEGWYYYFTKYWCFDLPFKIVFMNDSKTIRFSNNKIEQVKTGEGEWSDRLIAGLDKLDQEYVLYMQEDFWLNEPINYGKFLWLSKQIIDNKFNKLMLTSISVSGLENDREKTNLCYLDYHIYKIKNSERYLMSHQPTIWNKEFFRSCLDSNESPWNNEYAGSNRLRTRNEDLKFYHFIQDKPGVLQTWYNAVYNSPHNSGGVNGSYNALGIKMLEKMSYSS
jgi:hypothetical protein